MSCELTILMPCLNEAETLATCITKAQQWLTTRSVSGEVLIADNGSTDGSQRIAKSLGARVVDVPEKGYGAALIHGIKSAEGKYIIMGDSDDSYDFLSLDPFIEKLREGYDLVMGNRFKGGIEPGAMPALHRYLGNPLLSGIGKAFFHASCSDFHCGLRGFSKKAAEEMDLRTTGMEFASEMVIKSTILHQRICEVPTKLHPDGRTRPPHLRSWSDGWRHLRFMLLYCPRWLFLIPGLILFIIGLIGFIWLLTGPKQIGSVILETNSLLFFTFAMLLGFQTVLFALYTKVYALAHGLIPKSEQFLRLFKYIKLETALIIGAILVLIGFVGCLVFFFSWTSQGAGPLDTAASVRFAIPFLVSLYLGFTTIFSGFFLSVLGMKTDFWTSTSK